MTEQSRSHFVAAVLPYVQEVAAGSAAGIENADDREDAQADFLARAWEVYTALARQEPKPALCRVLCALYKPEPVWTHKPEPDAKILSMSNPKVRRMAEAVPA